MRCLAICQDELIIRTLDQLLLPSLHVEFLVQNRALARRLHEAGTHAMVGDPRRVDSYLKADISPSTCVIVEDNGKQSLKPILEAIHDAGGPSSMCSVSASMPAPSGRMSCAPSSLRLPTSAWRTYFEGHC